MRFSLKQILIAMVDCVVILVGVKGLWWCLDNIIIVESLDGTTDAKK